MTTQNIVNAPKSQQRTTTIYDAAHFTALLTIKHNQLHKQTQHHHSPKKIFEVLQLNANGISNKTDEIQLLIENTQVDIITIQQSKLNQSHKRPYLLHFALIKTDCTYKQSYLN